MKIHCHPCSPPRPSRYSRPAASGAPITCIIMPATRAHPKLPYVHNPAHGCPLVHPRQGC